MGDRLSRFENVALILIPPACREEVLGDLHERNTTELQYVFDALLTVPQVIVSRIRRTWELYLFTLYAAILYLCFFTTTWRDSPWFLKDGTGFLGLVVPCAAGILAAGLNAAYAPPGREAAMSWCGPSFAIAAVFASQAILWVLGSDLVLPLISIFGGSAFALVWMFIVRLCFPRPSSTRRGRI